jgi:hypothetical protein
VGAVRERRRVRPTPSVLKDSPCKLILSWNVNKTSLLLLIDYSCRHLKLQNLTPTKNHNDEIKLIVDTTVVKTGIPSLCNKIRFHPPLVQSLQLLIRFTPNRKTPLHHDTLRILNGSLFPRSLLWIS